MPILPRQLDIVLEKPVRDWRWDRWCVESESPLSQRLPQLRPLDLLFRSQGLIFDLLIVYIGCTAAAMFATLVISGCDGVALVGSSAGRGLGLLIDVTAMEVASSKVRRKSPAGWLAGRTTAFCEPRALTGYRAHSNGCDVQVVSLWPGRSCGDRKVSGRASRDPEIHARRGRVMAAEEHNLNQCCNKSRKAVELMKIEKSCGN